MPSLAIHSSARHISTLLLHAIISVLDLIPATLVVESFYDTLELAFHIFEPLTTYSAGMLIFSQPTSNISSLLAASILFLKLSHIFTSVTSRYFALNLSAALLKPLLSMNYLFQTSYFLTIMIFSIFQSLIYQLASLTLRLPKLLYLSLLLFILELFLLIKLFLEHFLQFLVIFSFTHNSTSFL